MWEIFEELMKRENLSISAAAIRCGCAPSTLTDWRAGRSKPKADKLYQIAKSFGVSVEYLLTGVETPQEPLSADERELLHLFRSLSPSGQTAALNMIRGLQLTPEYLKEKNTSLQVG